LSFYKEFFNSHDAKGTTLLMTAITNVRVSMVKILLDEGAEINAQDIRGMSSLHSAGELIIVIT
jgi:ankyrin repeat protein